MNESEVAYLLLTSYIQFSSIAARIVRRVLKPEQQSEALKREESIIKVTKWKEGRPVSSKFDWKSGI